MGLDDSLLTQHLCGHLASVYSLQMASWFHLASILSVDKALCNLGTFAFVASYLFSADGRHAADI